MTSKRRRFAFTLLEALLTFGLVAVVLGVATDLLIEYSRLLRVSASKSAEMSGIQVALNGILRDVRQSVALVSPPASPIYPRTAELRFLRILDPDWSTTPQPWLPVPIPTAPVTPAWKPQRATSLQEICYHKDDNGHLWRDRGHVGFSTNPGETYSLAESVAGFSVTTAGREIRVRLSFQGLNGVTVVDGVAMLPAW